MIITGEQKLKRFSEEYHAAATPLDRWRQSVSNSQWTNFFDVRQTLRSVDYYKGAVIFDIGGNKYRLIANINYRLGLVNVDYILTHLQYSTNKWKRDYDN